MASDFSQKIESFKRLGFSDIELLSQSFRKKTFVFKATKDNERVVVKSWLCSAPSTAIREIYNEISWYKKLEPLSFSPRVLEVGDDYFLIQYND